MNNKFMVTVENKIQGFSTRIKELHFSAPSYSVHKIIDEFDGEFKKFEDDLMENSQALWGFIEPGELSPVLPESMDFESLLEDIRGLLVNIKKESNDNMMWTGIINLVDDFFTTVNKYIYLIKIVKKNQD